MTTKMALLILSSFLAFAETTKPPANDKIINWVEKTKTPINQTIPAPAQKIILPVGAAAVLNPPSLKPAAPAFGRIKLKCNYPTVGGDSLCRELGIKKLDEKGCAVSSVNCVNSPTNGKSVCEFESTNCMEPTSNGFLGTFCHMGDRQNVDFGRDAKLDPGFMVGKSKSLPQVICLSPKSNGRLPSSAVRAIGPATRP